MISLSNINKQYGRQLVEVWSHIYLGKIFDISGQRERAVNEYTQAQRTRDNSQGAQDEVAKYLRTPVQSPEQRSCLTRGGSEILLSTGEQPCQLRPPCR
jgi:hypothetical protein